MTDRRWVYNSQSWRNRYLESLSEKQREKLIEEYKVVMSARNLARRYKVSSDTLYAYLRRWGVTLIQPKRVDT
jgi:Mor family transcriptional regulator